METVRLTYDLEEILQMSEDDLGLIQEGILRIVEEYCDNNNIDISDINYTTTGPIVNILIKMKEEN